MLVKNGEVLSDLPNDLIAPRTAIGLDKRNRKMIIAVVDGRQPFYSQGMTLQELAKLLIDYGAYIAMNMDGGGSSALVIEDSSGNAQVLNSPIDQYITGRERFIGNHLGIFVKK